MSVSTLAGYSLIVRAESPLSSETRNHSQIGEALSILAPESTQPGSVTAEPNMTLVNLQGDVLVAGGGMAGVCAAISAARHGAKVILVQDRSRLGGNASSEIKMHIVGADNHGARPHWREGGLIEEFRLEDAVRNSHRAYELWDLLLYDKCISEPNLTLLLDTSVYSTSLKSGKIESVMARCDKTEHLYRISAQIFCDCTGDSRLALEAGAEYRMGRESVREFGESLAPELRDSRTQGSSILFTARKHDRPMPYRPPQWARKITRDHLEHRPTNSWEYGYWWIELGGAHHTIRDNELLRFELLSVVLGTWDYIKNSGAHPSSANWALESVGMIPGKRESRRIMGDVLQTQKILETGWREMTDGVAIGGWNFDDHPPEGFDAPEKPPFRSIKLEEPYNISLGALYSRNISNLMMAGRNISNSHVAFSSTRVMATCSAIGQAVGTAAAQCAAANVSPRELRNDQAKLFRLQQTLLRDDQTIRKVKNEDSNDLARKARVTASGYVEGAAPTHVLTGRTRDVDGGTRNRWLALMPHAVGQSGPWLDLTWNTPQLIREIQITFDTGFQRELTLSASDSVTRRVVRAPQPETVSDYSLTAFLSDGESVELASITGNFQRLRRHRFEPIRVTRIRLQVHSTNGAKEARVYEVRCYA